MKKIKLAFGILACMCIIIVNLMVNIENKSGKFDFNLFNLKAMAADDPELPKLDTFDSTDYRCPPGGGSTWGRSCRPVSGGTPTCTVHVC